MQLKSTILFTIFLCFLFACAKDNGIQTPEEEFKTCLPEKIETDFSALIDRFNAFLERDYNGSIVEFVEVLETASLPEKIEYTEEDLKVGIQLIKNNFNENIFTLYQDTSYTIVYSKAQNQNIKQPRIRTLQKVDIEKPYLSCILHSLEEEDPLSKYIVGEAKYNVFVALENFASQPEYDLRELSNSRLLHVLLATEMYSGMLIRAAQRKVY